MPYINRFLSADTIVPDPANPQSFNRYSYVQNNPINRIDPSGHCDYSSEAVTSGYGEECRQIAQLISDKYGISLEQIMHLSWTYGIKGAIWGGNEIISYEQLHLSTDDGVFSVLADGQNMYKLSMTTLNIFMPDNGENENLITRFIFFSEQHANAYDDRDICY